MHRRLSLPVGLVILMSSSLFLQGQEPAPERPAPESESSPAAVEVECTERSGRCPELRIRGTSPARLPDGRPSPFRGFADPSIRQDPETGRLWMAYSWPNLHVLRADQAAQRGRPREPRRRTTRGRPRVVPGIDTHLAYSDDQGKTWQFHGPLWPSHPATDRGRTGEPGYTVHEAPNLLPRQTLDGVIWYGARLNYFYPEDRSVEQRPPHSFRIAIGKASSPDGLAEAPMQILGSAVTAKGWGVDLYLSTLSPTLRDCALWNEPALYAQDEELYLALRCLRFEGRRPRVADSDIVVFATDAVGDVRTWSWRYVGRLAGGEEARALGGEGLTQIDLAYGRDGRLLLVASPDDWNARLQEFVHFGCRVVEVESIDPPKLARDRDGNLKLRASVTAPDQEPLGPGACTYDPASETGVVLVRREKAPGTMTASMHATGVRP